MKRNIILNKGTLKYLKTGLSSIKIIGLFLAITLVLTNCSDFVEVDPPKNILISETVFEDPATIKSAFANIYFKMREQGIISGLYGATTVMGIYSDELDYLGHDPSYQAFYTHNVTESNTILSSWWTHAYNIIYASNAIIEGVNSSDSLIEEDRNQFLGQAFFVRAYMHSLLLGLYGEIPYVTTTDYIKNNKVTRLSINIVYNHLISDLNNATDLLNVLDPTSERVIPCRATALALLARIYLYSENWQLAESTTTELIETYNLELDIDQVFRKDSKETLWQFKPSTEIITNTQEAQTLIIPFLPSQGYAISESLLSAFEPGDLRQSKWIEEITSDDGLTTLHFAHKYKETINTTSESLEYSILFRLTEQYLIRAESRAQLGNILGSREDLNEIRLRAGLNNFTGKSKLELLQAITKERQVELFTEFGFRWIDLKRLGIAENVLSEIKPSWSSSHLLLPIPQSEIELNPNLKLYNPEY